MTGKVIDGVSVIARTPENEAKIVTFAKRFPPYVFSVSKNGCLVHKIALVELRWYDYYYDVLIKCQRPHMIARTVCGVTRFLEAKRSRTCLIPAPEAVLCGVCHGDGPTFGARKIPDQSARRTARKWASVRLGCAVQGYLK